MVHETNSKRRALARLSLSGERQLLAAAQRGDRASREELVDAFLPLIGGVARKYRNTAGVSRDELVQEGVVGLLRAVERYDAGRERPFWAYASWWVRQAMQELVSQLARPVGLSDRALRQLARVRQAQRDHLQAAGEEPSIADLVGRTSLARERIESLIAVDRTPRGFDEPIGGDRDAPGVTADTVADPRAEDDYERVDRKLEIEQLRRLPAHLCDRERVVLYAHYGIDRPSQTLREIARSLGLSAERVRQVEEDALGKLRVELAR